MKELNGLKRELSKLTGIDLFNPKYAEVFKKYFPEDEKEEVEDVKELEPEIKEEDTKVEDKVEDIDKAEDEREIDKIEEDKAEDKDKEEEKKEEVNEESEEIGKDVDELKEEAKPEDDLLDAKLELELMKNNVKPERMEAVKKYAKFVVKSIEELDKVKEMLKEYPEWKQGYKAEDFGMKVDEDNDSLTEEEKRLKAMGIDPKN